MGYDAFVPCTCYRDGRTADPPHKEHVVFEEGIYGLSDEIWDDPDQDLYFRMHADLEKWKAEACPHEDMELVEGRLANAMGAGVFRRALTVVPDLARIPILNTEVMRGNDGGLSPKQCREMLAEIALVREYGGRTAARIGLFKDDDPHPSYTTLSGERTTFEFGPGREGRIRHTWLDETGIVVYEPSDSDDWTKGGYELFHSKKFAEVAYEEPRDEYVGAWVDVDTKHAYPRKSLMSQQHEDKGALEIVYYEVREEKARLIPDIEHKLDLLERLAKAGIETGYGVYWT